jgi:hypothetical protein
MAKVITFSRTFPAYHPKAGQPTYFVEKFYNSLFSRNNLMDYPKGLEINGSILEMKNHTIRAGERWKKGEYFSPRVWSGKPYNTPQIILAKDTLITDIYDFEISKHAVIYLNRKPIYEFCGEYTGVIKTVAKNDGLEPNELLDWFKYPKEFNGQIICWNKNARY